MPFQSAPDSAVAVPRRHAADAVRPPLEARDRRAGRAPAPSLAAGLVAFDAFFTRLPEAAEAGGLPTTSGPGSPSAVGRTALHGRPGVPHGRAVGPAVPDHHLHRLPDPRLPDGLHGARPGLRALLRLPEPVLRLDAGAGAGRQPAGDVRRLGRRRSVQLPADRLLVHRERQRRRRQEGVHHQPHR